jgi:hypothetical protein
MRRKPGEIGWGKSAFGNKTKTAAHHAHHAKMKKVKPIKNGVSKKTGITLGNIAGVGVRGWLNG